MSVFTNQPEVTLSLNGTVVGTKQAVQHRADFEELPLCDGENIVSVTAGSVSDCCTFCGVPEHDSSYDLPELAACQKAGNWFTEAGEGEELPEGERYDIDDSLFDLMENETTWQIIRGWVMAKEDAPLDLRLLCVMKRKTQKIDGPKSRLRDKKKTFGAIMTEEDFEILNRRLHTVRKEKK